MVKLSVIVICVHLDKAYNGCELHNVLPISNSLENKNN